MRKAGILLHPSSLPGPCGIGDIGPSARSFVGWLEEAGQQIWQFLPLNPVDGGGSPYNSPSAFAREPLLLSTEDLVVDGWLRQGEVPGFRGNPHRIHFPSLRQAKQRVLDLAADRVAAQVDLDRWAALRPWAGPWGLFAALRGSVGPDWRAWPTALRDGDPRALEEAREQHRGLIHRHLALQWLFELQWGRLRAEARRRGVELWGDMPIFVSGGSCDAWAHKELFRLDGRGYPEVVTGVPPDAFSPEGQLWGHPHYRDEAHAASGYRWWGDRVEGVLALCDQVRVDHFRGFAGVWEIPAHAQRATEGHWIGGMGAPLLEALRDRVGSLPLIAEDLGIITPEVEALRDDFGLPGMAILQFAFGPPFTPEHAYLPHNHRENLVVYPGTHDNNTTVGWFAWAGEEERHWVRRYLGTDGGAIAWNMLRAAYLSPARYAILTLQDALRLGPDARMNLPGVADGNWSWRVSREALNGDVAGGLREEAWIAARTPRR
ncbi:MAG: 4-alpha-glucanotransferase [Deltaproteobacteria bacterium]|nr:4-alpha-glucanotransferase [Deltaproteobacteria bacterium]